MDYNVKHFVLVYLTGCLFRKLVFLCTFSKWKSKTNILHTNSFISSFWFLIGILFFKGHGWGGKNGCLPDRKQVGIGWRTDTYPFRKMSAYYSWRISLSRFFKYLLITDFISKGKDSRSLKCENNSFKDWYGIQYAIILKWKYFFHFEKDLVCCITRMILTICLINR